MNIKLHLLAFIIPCALQAINIAEEDAIAVNFCFNSSLEGYRLNMTILMTKVVPHWLKCVLECVKEPCCRSINYKKTVNLPIESNCEMLHNLVYNTSQKFLETNCSYNHVYLNSPRKVKIVTTWIYDIYRMGSREIFCHAFKKR